MADWKERWLQEILDKDKREHPDETEYQRSQRRKAVIAQEKHDHAQRMSRQTQNEEAEKQNFYFQYMEDLNKTVRQMEKQKEFHTRRTGAWHERKALESKYGRRHHWPPEVEQEFVRRFGLDAVSDMTHAKPNVHTDYQEKELARYKDELSNFHRQTIGYQNQFRLPPIPRAK